MLKFDQREIPLPSASIAHEAMLVKCAKPNNVRFGSKPDLRPAVRPRSLVDERPR